MGAALAALLTVSAEAAKRPNPPPTVCIGSTCVNSPPPGGGKIKWNPGHYAAGNGSLLGGTKAESWYGTMDGALTNYPQFQGFRIWVSWSQIETAKGVYDFSQIDAILNRLKTQYKTPRHLVMTLYPSGPVSKWNHDTRIIPQYIQSDPAYGPSPVAGSYGWWGINEGGQSTGPYEPAIWRPAVMDRYIALVQAIAAHYDQDPNFEALMFQEDIYHILAARSDYTKDNMLAQVKRLLTASVAAFPHTSVVFENTWGLGFKDTAQDLEAWMVANRVAPGTADTLGETAFQLADAAGITRSGSLNWGIAAYMGINDVGGSYTGGDLRTKSRAMLDIEADDLAGTYYAKSGGPFAPADICVALNKRYMASHAFWDHFIGTEKVRGQPLPAAALWPNLAAALEKCPLTNTSYPPNYPQ
jgi:hypothetical protein